MSFPESLKLSVRQRAHFRCCLCRAIGIEIHHIIPQEEGGPDTEENAAPLCPSCHEIYGANPTKRKFLREARDFWYQLCSETSAKSGLTVADLNTAIASLATKDDIEQVRSHLAKLVRSTLQSSQSSTKEEFKSVPLEQFIRSLYEEDFGKRKSCYDIFFSSYVWHTSTDHDYEMLDARAFFLKAYGEETAKRICLLACKESNFNPDGFTTEEFARTSAHIQTIVLLIIGHIKFSQQHNKAFECVMRRDGQILWRNAKAPRRQSKLVQNKQRDATK